MTSPQFVTNGTEKTFVYEKDGLRTNLSDLVSAGNNDPACICYAQYKDGQDAPVVEIKFNEEEQEMLRKLLTR